MGKNRQKGFPQDTSKLWDLPGIDTRNPLGDSAVTVGLGMRYGCPFTSFNVIAINIILTINSFRHKYIVYFTLIFVLIWWTELFDWGCKIVVNDDFYSNILIVWIACYHNTKFLLRIPINANLNLKIRQKGIFF